MKREEALLLKHGPGCSFVEGKDFCDCGAIEQAITAENTALRSALERTLTNFKLLLAGRPVRSAAETIAEAEAALG